MFGICSLSKLTLVDKSVEIVGKVRAIGHIFNLEYL